MDADANERIRAVIAGESEGAIVCGDVLDTLRAWPDACVQCVVTSPPYWGLRSYLPSDHGDKAREIGMEPTLAEYVEKLTIVFREVRRVLRDDGTLWLNMGDSYTSGNRKTRDPGQRKLHPAFEGESYPDGLRPQTPYGLKVKEICGVPWLLAFALQADGWYLRQDIIWHKPNPMPESVTDRCTKAHEYLFLLSKGPRYYYDAEAIKEPQSELTLSRAQCGAPRRIGRKQSTVPGGSTHLANWDYRTASWVVPGGRNKRSVWTIPTFAFSGAHFATFPPKLVEPCILAGTSERGCCAAFGSPWRRVTTRERITRKRPHDYVKRTGEAGTGNSCSNAVAGVSVETLEWEPTCDCGAGVQPCIVLDPFMGSGTVAHISAGLGRAYLGTELNAEYIDMARLRIHGPLFAAGDARDEENRTSNPCLPEGGL